MANSSKVLAALEEVKAKLMAMSTEELTELWTEHQKTYIPDPVFNEWIAEALKFDYDKEK